MSSNKYTYNLNVFTREDELSYYLLGVFMTDGNIKVNKLRSMQRSVRLCSNDIDWLTEIKNLICKELPITKKSNSKACGEFTINSNKLADWFISKKCTPNKSLTLEYPDVPKKYIPDFIRGCMDGDGTIYFGKAKTRNKYYTQFNCSFGVASKSFFEKFKIILKEQKLSFYERAYTPKPKIGKSGKICASHEFYTIMLTGKSAVNFIKWIYPSNHVLSLERKRLKAMEIIRYYKTRNGKSHTRTKSCF